MRCFVYVPVMSDDRILVFSMDPGCGKLSVTQDLELGKRPFPVCTDPAQRSLQIGLNDGETSYVGSYRIDPVTGALTPIGEVALGGDPCYLATDRKGRFLLAAYYVAGMVTVHAIGEDGAARGPAVDRHETERYAHYIATDPSNRYAFVPHVESANSIYQYLFDENTGRLTPNEVPVIDGGPGQGPLHLGFHPSLDIVYADNEQGSSVTVYRLDTSNGRLEAVQNLSTLPDDGFGGENSNAQLHLHPTGRAVYASNRGHDSIAMFAIEPVTGGISSMGQQPSEEMPRPFSIDPSGNFLFAAGDRSGRLAAYRIDPRGGLDSLGGTYDLGGRPAWVFSLGFA